MNNRKFKNSKREKEFYFTLRNRVHSELNDSAFKHGKTDFWVKGLFWFVISYGLIFPIKYK